MNIKSFLLLALLSFILQSCDCWIVVHGKIIDATTDLPVNGANIEFINIKSIDYKKSNDSIPVDRIFKSDSIGNFDMISVNYGMCPKIIPEIKIEKKGYKSLHFVMKPELYTKEKRRVIIKLEKK